ncbi:hypothetical protein TRIATDRAFT_317300 [Trichoderma atroviride IMI 206040]|uniref:Uncharacterized protein n=1 Tax=Hypocrea atroviridis (strain ATCC 20476 / IMI 206040) TaxID=452589 RepID=G9NS92_HYPAI|nr:uncharacterized protein TRIATDRAFT_317300 [Trichoderma atroviride IMI 206040]EHK46294.1 hypothetical protein TRIATDRAFT_317300 [Trichoderma atroviride IMI 206040]
MDLPGSSKLHLFQERDNHGWALISNFTPAFTMAAESCSMPSNFGRGAYDTTGLPKPPPPQPQ